MSLNLGVMSAAVTLDDADYRNKLNGLENSSESTFKRVATLAAGYLSLRGMFGFASTAIKTFSDLQEETNKFNVVFQGMGTETSRVLEELRKKFGLSELAAKKMLAGTGDILTGFGFDRSVALDLSEGAAKLGADLASFSNYAGGQVEIAGIALPAPTAAAFCLLEIIDSPFVVAAPEAAESSLDVFRALYILGRREHAAPALLCARREQLQFDALAERFAGAALPPESLFVLQEGARRLAAAWAEFDVAALEFGAALGGFDWRQAVADLQTYLTLATGFSMIPYDATAGEDTKKNGSTPPTG